MEYEGKIDISFCFLDTPEEKYSSPEVNTIGIYRFGYSPAFCEKEYKLLTPECAWYPVSVPLYHSLGFLGKDVHPLHVGGGTRSGSCWQYPREKRIGELQG